MARWSLGLVVALAAVAPARADAGKTVYETWQAAYLEGAKIGHTHTVVREVKEGGRTVYRTSREMHLTVKRYGSVIPIRVDQTYDETAAGKVLALSETHAIGKSKKIAMSGKVENGKLVLSGDALPKPVTVPWDDKAQGAYAQELAFQKAKVKKGDKLVTHSYELLLASLLTVRAVVKDEEAVDRLVAKKDGDKVKMVRESARLLRVEAAPDEVKVGDKAVQLPKKVVWLDGKRLPVREQFEQLGLGTITVYNTTKDGALKEGVAPELLPDLGLNISISVRKVLDKPYKVSEAVYKVTLKEEIKDVFSSDERQEVKNKKEKSFDLAVKARRSPIKVANAAEVDEKYLKSSHFIPSDNEQIKKLAAKAVGKETGAWKKALLLEKWVHDNMKVSTSVGFPTAAEIAKDLEGDCRQHALLLVALCRAAGVPARTAIGLIYAREQGKTPYFGFHMWAEVYVEGQWLGLDAILGEGGIGATHLKMGDHSWADTRTLAPLLPVSQALGKLHIEITSAK
jgi:hypothetical protein